MFVGQSTSVRTAFSTADYHVALCTLQYIVDKYLSGIIFQLMNVENRVIAVCKKPRGKSETKTDQGRKYN